MFVQATIGVIAPFRTTIKTISKRNNIVSATTTLLVEDDQQYSEVQRFRCYFYVITCYYDCVFSFNINSCKTFTLTLILNKL